jgi:hypothetical protein
MKNVLLFGALALCLNSYGQSKKEQIAALNYSIDSLNVVVQTERGNASQSIQALNMTIDLLNTDLLRIKNQAITDIDSLLKKIEKQRNVHKGEIIIKENIIDSLRYKLNNPENGIFYDSTTRAFRLVTSYPGASDGGYGTRFKDFETSNLIDVTDDYCDCMGRYIESLKSWVDEEGYDGSRDDSKFEKRLHNASYDIQRYETPFTDGSILRSGFSVLLLDREALRLCKKAYGSYFYNFGWADEYLYEEY